MENASDAIGQEAQKEECALADSEARRDLYLKTRESYVDKQCEQSNLRDKYVLTLSGAALALSMAYIEKVGPLQSARYVALLVASWFLFSVALIGAVFSFHYSVNCYSDYIDQMDSKYIAGSDFDGLSSKRERIVVLLNNISILAFVAGITFFGLFAAVNTFLNARTYW